MSVHGLMIAPKAARTPPWLVTFVDLVLVMLSFFILMFSMSRPDPARYMAMAKSYLETFGPGTILDATFVNSRSYVQDAASGIDDLVYLEIALKSAFARSANLDGLQFRSTERYLVISLPAAIGRDGVAVSEHLKPSLFDLAGVFANIENRLAVIGLAEPTADSWTAGLRHAGLIADALARSGYDRPINVLTRAVATGEAPSGAVEILIMADHDQPLPLPLEVQP